MTLIVLGVNSSLLFMKAVGGQMFLKSVAIFISLGILSSFLCASSAAGKSFEKCMVPYVCPSKPDCFIQLVRRYRSKSATVPTLKDVFCAAKELGDECSLITSQQMYEILNELVSKNLIFSCDDVTAGIGVDLILFFYSILAQPGQTRISTCMTSFYNMFGPQPKGDNTKALIAAVSDGDSAKVEHLLLLGANPNFCFFYPEHFVSGDGMFDEITSYNDCRHPYFKTILERAIESGNVEIVKSLIRYGANVHQVNGQGVTAIFLAVTLSQYEIVKELLSAGACVDYTSHGDNQSPLFRATDVHIARLLFDAAPQMACEKDVSEELPFWNEETIGQYELREAFLFIVARFSKKLPVGA